MEYILDNGQLRAVIKSFGAELKSLQDKTTGQEYMWEADPEFWGKTSPVLFPFIGKLEGSGYRYQDAFYSIEKHGFARDMEFTVVSQGDDRIAFAIESDETTLQKFPFAFRLELAYALEGRSLTETWKVINNSGESMYFSFGGHPAFACPPKKGMTAGTARTACFIRLYGADGERLATEELVSTDIGVPDGLLTGEHTRLELTDGFLPVTEHIFDQDALCLERQGITAVGLCDSGKKEYVRLEADCPVWGIWSVPDSNAGYICLEPWWGICDSRGYAGSLQERPYTNMAAAGQSCEAAFRIIVR